MFQGITEDDPRIADTMECSAKKEGPFSKSDFLECIRPNINFLEKVFSNDLVIPDFPGAMATFQQIYDEVKKNNNGKVVRLIILR
jgi:hypothetical protein